MSKHLTSRQISIGLLARKPIIEIFIVLDLRQFELHLLMVRFIVEHGETNFEHVLLN